MKPKQLLELGFKEVNVTVEEWGGEKGFRYYVFEPFEDDDSTVSLISDSIDEGEEDRDLSVEFFNTRDNQAPLSDKFIKMFTKEFRNHE